MEDLTEDGKPKVKKRPVALLVVIAVVGIALMTGLAFLSQRSEFMDYNYTLMISAKAMNLTCPQMVDEATRLDSVTAKPDKLFTYHYTLVSASKLEMDSTFFCVEWNKNVRTAAKGHKDLAEFGRNGVTLIYAMKDKAGSELCTITLPAAEYYVPK